MFTYHPSQKRKRVYVRETLESRFWKYVSKTDKCWIWTGSTRNFGYGVINEGGDKGRILAAHRVSWEIHFGTIPEGLCVCHHCDNPICVRPDHLFLGTKADNNRDMQQKGRYDKVKRPKGEKHGMSKLTEEDVLSIRKNFSAGAPIRELATQYKIAFQSIWRIVYRKNWKHI